MKNYYDKNNQLVSLLQPNDIEVGNGYIKFSNGVAFLFGSVYAKENVAEGEFKFPLPLIDTSYTVIATHHWSYSSKGIASIGVLKNDSVKVNIYDDDFQIVNFRSAYVLVIGRWK